MYSERHKKDLATLERIRCAGPLPTYNDLNEALRIVCSYPTRETKRLGRLIWWRGCAKDGPYQPSRKIVELKSSVQAGKTEQDRQRDLYDAWEDLRWAMRLKAMPEWIPGEGEQP